MHTTCDSGHPGEPGSALRRGRRAEGGMVGGVPRRLRPLPALAVAVVLVATLTAVLVPFRDHLTSAVPALLLEIPVVVAAYFGGRAAAVVVALVATATLDAAFVPPFGSPRAALSEDVVALVVFALVAVAIGGLVASVLVFEQRRAEAELARIEALEATDRQRSALLRSVSHDLRTPLATIRAVATDLHAATEYDDATRTELLGLVVDESERLDRLVANLLSMSRVEAGSLLPERRAVDLTDLVATVTHRLRRPLRDVHLVASLPDDLPLLQADESQLDQVITNLLENAARHSPAGGSVWIGASATATTVTLTVDDEGPGVDPAIRDAIFEPFFATTGSSTGVGLAICRAVVDAHGGSIHVGSSPSGGARFSVTMPLDG